MAGKKAREVRAAEVTQRPVSSTPPTAGISASLVEPEGLRERVLRASQELIESEGLTALSMREVARRAGVSHQAPYNHFADREAILAALVEDGFDRLRARLRAILDEPKARARGLHVLMAALGQAYVEFACAYPAHFRVMFRPELVDLERCHAAREAGDRAFACLTETVGEAQREGFLAKAPSEAVVALIWSVTHGLACLTLDGPLAMKLPTAERHELIAAVMHGFGQLVKTQLTQAEDKKSRKATGSVKKRKA